MAVQRRLQFIYGQVGGMLLAILGLVALNALSFELVFVTSLLVFLVMLEVTAPINVQPRWRRRLRWLAVLGLAVFGYIVIQRILALVPPGAL
jgi:hypothetical protein